MENEEMTYAAAMAELEAILAAMNEKEPDVDSLAAQVRRAGELLAWCRARLRRTEEEVSAALGDAEESER